MAEPAAPSMPGRGFNLFRCLREISRANVAFGFAGTPVLRLARRDGRRLPAPLDFGTLELRTTAPDTGPFSCRYGNKYRTSGPAWQGNSSPQLLRDSPRARTSSRAAGGRRRAGKRSVGRWNGRRNVSQHASSRIPVACGRSPHTLPIQLRSSHTARKETRLRRSKILPAAAPSLPFLTLFQASLALIATY